MLIFNPEILLHSLISLFGFPLCWIISINDRVISYTWQFCYLKVNDCACYFVYFSQFHVQHKVLRHKSVRRKLIQVHSQGKTLFYMLVMLVITDSLLSILIIIRNCYLLLSCYSFLWAEFYLKSFITLISDFFCICSPKNYFHD